MVAASLAGGGAERALLDTACLLAQRGHEVTVVTFEDGSSDAYPVPAGIGRRTLSVPGYSGNRLRGLINNLRRIIRLRRAIATLRPDVVVSYLTRTNVICLLSLMATGCPVVATEHNVMSLPDSPMLYLWRRLRRLLYGRAASVVAVCEGLGRQYDWLPKGKLSVIQNFLPARRGLEPEAFGFLTAGTRHIVAMGRLEPEKGFDRLLTAFHRVARESPGWDLVVVGEGSLRPALTRLAASLGLQSRVKFPGRVGNARTLFSQCDLFVLSSESEGFGLVLVEAMSVALPVISFDCDFGPREIITPGVSGLLVPPGDVDSLANAMKRVMGDEALRVRLGVGARQESARFSADETGPRWEALLRRVAGFVSIPSVPLHAAADEAS
jgi:glycosyltransferase involved in cell wall biosynthesis